MRIMSYLILPFMLYVISLFTDSPHGKDFKISCSTCHSSKGWTLDKEIYAFDHSSTKLPLLGQHKEVNCKLCHPTLVFEDAKSKSECVNCHTDIHSQTVGQDCNKCHDNNSWLVNNITQIHQQNRFPLLGVHTMTECQKCHLSESLHRYDVLGVECIDCHRDNFMSATKPNHVASNFSTECSQCHYLYAYEWGGAGFNHSFFPLTLGHANIDCARCHINGNYNISPDCYSCHQADYNSTTNPVHVGSCYPTNCKLCHTTNPGWSPVSFQHDAQYFPISSGKHSGISCNQCHTNSADCSVFSCIDCHEHNQSEMNNEHNGESGYSYTSSACYRCHPRGTGD